VEGVFCEVELPLYGVLGSSSWSISMLILQMFDQMLYQEPVNLVYPDPTAHVLDEAGPRPRPEATVGDLDIADVV